MVQDHFYQGCEMRMTLLRSALLTVALASAIRPVLGAQSLPKEPTPRQKAEIDKELRKSLMASNHSDREWAIGLEPNDAITGQFQILAFNEKKNQFEVKKSFNSGDEIKLKKGEQIVISP